MLLIIVNFCACSQFTLKYFYFQQRFIFSLHPFPVLLSNNLSPLLHTILRKWQLGKLNQSFNKNRTAMGFDKWGGWSGTVQKETEGGHISPWKINSSWSCWLHHFITFVSEFSGCLQHFLPTNYSLCSLKAAAVNPGISSRGKMVVVSLLWAQAACILVRVLIKTLKAIMIPYVLISEKQKSRGTEHST